MAWKTPVEYIYTIFAVYARTVVNKRETVKSILTNIMHQKNY